MCVLPSLPEFIVSKVDLNFPLTVLFGLIDATFQSCLRTDMRARSFSPQGRLDFLSYPGFLVRKTLMCLITQVEMQHSLCIFEKFPI